MDLDRFTRDQGSGRGSPGTRPCGAQAQLAEKVVRLDRAQEDRPMLGRGGHDRHSPPSKEIEAIGSVVRMPQVLALRIPPDAPQRPIARQMIQRDAGQRLAVAMMREQLRRAHGRNSGGVIPARKRRRARLPPLCSSRSHRVNLHRGRAITSSRANIAARALEPSNGPALADHERRTPARPYIR